MADLNQHRIDHWQLGQDANTDFQIGGDLTVSGLVGINAAPNAAQQLFVVAESGNCNGIYSLGIGTGNGIKATGGSNGAAGVVGYGGSGNGYGGYFQGDISGSGAGGLYAQAGGTAASAIVAVATGTGTGVLGISGPTSGAAGLIGIGTNNGNTIGVIGYGNLTGAGIIGYAGEFGNGLYGVGGWSSGVGVLGEGTASGAGGRFVGGATGYGAIIEANSTSPVSSSLRLVPQDNNPSTAQIGDFYVNQSGILRSCVTAGSPGTWVAIDNTVSGFASHSKLDNINDHDDHTQYLNIERAQTNFSILNGSFVRNINLDYTTTNVIAHGLGRAYKGFLVVSRKAPPCHFHVNLVSSQSLDPGTSKILWDSEVRDYGNDFASNVFTVPVNGLYDFQASCYLVSALADTQRFLMVIRQNSTDLAEQDFSAASSFFPTVQVSAINRPLAAGDTVSVWANHNNGGARSVSNDAQYTWFTGRLVDIGIIEDKDWLDAGGNTTTSIALRCSFDQTISIWVF